MAGIDYEKYLVRKPVYKGTRTIKSCHSPTMTYMSNHIVPGCDVYIELGWVNGVPEPNPRMLQHTHDYDEVLMFIGSDPYHPEDLGGEIEYYLGGQPLTFDTTSAIYVPRGVPHGRLAWKRVDKPYLEMAMIFGGVNTGEGWSNRTGGKPRKELPPRKEDIDYKKYLVRGPLYQEDRRTIKDGRGPVMVYMCNDLIPEVNLYIDYVWIFTVPPPHIFEHVHDKYNEVVLHVGGEPDSPEDLGAEIEYYVSGQPLVFDKTTALYVPKGLKHGPLNWKRVDKPHLQMPIIIGAGSMAQAMPGGYQVE